MKIIIPAGIGIIMSITAYYLNSRRNIARWMRERKVEAWTTENRKCPTCGKKMQPAAKKADGRKVWFCQDWQKCHTYIEHSTGERLSAAEIERTDGKRAL